MLADFSLHVTIKLGLYSQKYQFFHYFDYRKITPYKSDGEVFDNRNFKQSSASAILLTDDFTLNHHDDVLLCKSMYLQTLFIYGGCIKKGFYIFVLFSWCLHEEKFELVLINLYLQASLPLVEYYLL